VMDVWKLNDSGKFTGSIELVAGQVYDLRVEYFNDLLGGVIELYWVRPDAEKPFLKFGEPIGELISARYFQQATSPVSKPPKPAVTAPVVVAATPAKPAPKPAVVAAARPAKPISNSSASVRELKPIRLSRLPEAATPQRPVANVNAEPVPEPSPVMTASAEAKPTILQHVQFEQSSYVLLPESVPELSKLLQVLQDNPAWRIELIGHTDNVGDPRINQTLSEYRARVVMTYLTSHGIADDRIDTKGYGGSRPIADNATEGGRATNRRVEFVVK
jgi:outer membrane protein OmpA-like peptidoglycan-associated protein